MKLPVILTTALLLMLQTSVIEAGTGLPIGAAGAKKLTIGTIIGTPLVKFQVEAAIEDIKGVASDVKGSITFDPQNIEGTKGEIVVATASMNTSLKLRDDHMFDKDWLDAANYPTITCTIEKLIDVLVKNVDATAGQATVEAKAVGTFTLHGVTKSLTMPIRLVYLKESANLKQKGITNAVSVQAKFPVLWKDYGVKGKKNLGMSVGESVDIDVTLYATL